MLIHGITVQPQSQREFCNTIGCEADIGVVDVGDYVMSMTITDGAETLDPIRWLIDAFGYWEKLFRSENWIMEEKRLPDKIIRAPNVPAASATSMRIVV